MCKGRLRKFSPLPVQCNGGDLLLLRGRGNRQLKASSDCTSEILQAAAKSPAALKSLDNICTFNYCEIGCLAKLAILKIYRLFMVQTENRL